MILDNIKNSKLYYGVHENFDKAFEFIIDACKNNLPVGKYEIVGDKVFAMVQEYETKIPADDSYEGHEKYIDIQYIIEGIESINITEIANTSLKTQYSDEYDAAFYEKCKNGAKCVFTDGDFGIFFPHDIHKPGMAYENNPSNVKKIVVKVRV